MGLQYGTFVKLPMVRAILLGVMAVLTFLFPEFLQIGMVYLISAYLIINGILIIIKRYLSRSVNFSSYLNYFIAILLVVFGVLSIVYFRHIVSILPVFIGVLAILEGSVYLFIAYKIDKKFKSLLIIVAILLLLGGVAVNIFTFGFGDLLRLSRLTGVLLLLSLLYECIIFLSVKKTAKQ